MEIAAEDPSLVRQLHLRETLYDARKQTIKAIRFTNTRQSQDSYHNPAFDRDFLRSRVFQTFAMHAQPSFLQYRSPRYNCLLMKGARSREAPWNTTTLQMLGCEWRCWYCYVDPINLSSSSPHAVELSVAEILSLIERLRPEVLDISGGQPDLIPEFTYACAATFGLFNHSTWAHVRSEDNLNNDFLWRFLSSKQVGSLAISEFYTRIGCFKGFDDPSVQSVVGPSGSCGRQMEVAKALVGWGFEPFFYATFSPGSEIDIETRLRRFFRSLQRIEEWLPLRVVPLKLRPPKGTLRQSTFDRKGHLNDLANNLWFHLVMDEFGESAFKSEIQEFP